MRREGRLKYLLLTCCTLLCACTAMPGQGDIDVSADAPEYQACAVRAAIMYPVPNCSLVDADDPASRYCSRWGRMLLEQDRKEFIQACVSR